MALTIAHIAVAVLGVWTALGVLFAIAFVAIGAGRVDHDALTGGLGFRLLLFPGAVAFWPFLLVRWMRGSGEAPHERNAHRLAAREQRS